MSRQVIGWLLIGSCSLLPCQVHAQWSVAARTSLNAFSGSTTRAEFVDGVAAQLRPEDIIAVEATVERQLGNWAVAFSGLRGAPSFVFDQQSFDITPELAGARVQELAGELHRVVLRRDNRARVTVFAGPQVAWWRPPSSDALQRHFGIRAGTQGDLPITGRLLLSIRGQFTTQRSPVEEEALTGTLLERRALRRLSLGMGLRRVF